MPETVRTIKQGTLYRTAQIRAEDLSVEDRTVDLAFSSESPIERIDWIDGTTYLEVLDHRPKSVRLDRLKRGGPVLLDHDTRDLVGVVEDARIDTASRIGRARIRLGKGNRAEEVLQDVRDGIRQSISIGYNVRSWKEEKPTAEGEPRILRATDWEPFEISFVAVPADVAVGVGRNSETETREVPIYSDEPDPIEDAAPRGEAPMPEPNAHQTPETPPADPQKIERDRVARILALGKRHAQTDLAEQFIRDGRTVEDFGTAVLERIHSETPPTPPPDPRLGMNQREIRKYSFLRVLNAFANPTDRAAREAAAFELEVSDSILQKERRDLKGGANFTVPPDVLYDARRDLVVGTASIGGNLVQTDVLAASFVDVLRAKMVTAQLGATVLSGLTGKVAIPTKSAAVLAYWPGENTAPTEGAMTVGQITMDGKTVAAFQDIGRRLLIQSSVDVENMVRDDIAGSIAVAIDAVAFSGTSTSNQPTGILNTSGIGDVAGGTNGLAVAWSHIVSLEYEVAVDNADIGRLAYVTTPHQRKKMKSIQKGTNQGFIWSENDPANPLNGHACGISNNVPSNLTKGTSTTACSAIIFGNFADLLIGTWAGLDILVDPYTGSSAGTVRVVGLQDVDVAVRHAESFAAMKDALNA